MVAWPDFVHGKLSLWICILICPHPPVSSLTVAEAAPDSGFEVHEGHCPPESPTRGHGGVFGHLLPPARWAVVLISPRCLTDTALGRPGCWV